MHTMDLSEDDFELIDFYFHDGGCGEIYQHKKEGFLLAPYNRRLGSILSKVNLGFVEIDTKKWVQFFDETKQRLAYRGKHGTVLYSG